MGKEVIIGIDLGTTNSEAAHLEGGRPVIIPSSEGSTDFEKLFSLNEDSATELPF